MAEPGPRRGGNRLTAESYKTMVILRLYDSGRDVASIARQTGYSRDWVQKVIHRARGPQLPS